ncbi:MAG: archaellin/type IV pilin N-terminal domain-containing protein, partial [Candidatus Bathyarchaeia archaeon]
MLMGRREAISPVIATIIIIAVTIAISLAVAAWLMGLWGGFVGGPKISASLVRISNSSVNNEQNKINATVLFTNTGNAPDKIDSTAAVTLRVGGNVYACSKMDDTTTTAITIDPTPPGTSKRISFIFDVDDTTADDALVGS